ncbi:cold-shock protein [Actinophytocola xanthii]|uniref:DNA-binding protein n=1 Tax=Actinophytocola xanthii TaxID=1912961 RepID=A0A1Q8CTC3_9PSEU|nr:cold shock domain-containing protein [Actinophytocola xanthii]OLF17621.1 DNA-binding protein [Actinophytocola xanthii]
MVSGKVVRFDEARGYGFVAPDIGGEDVFLHVNDITFDKRLLVPGARVDFEIEEGDRGPKATYARMSTPAQTHAPANAHPEGGDADFCEVLTEREFLTDVTELLLAAVPTITAGDVVRTRLALVGWAKKRGWVETV